MDIVVVVAEGEWCWWGELGRVNAVVKVLGEVARHEGALVARSLAIDAGGAGSQTIKRLGALSPHRLRGVFRRR